MNCLRQNAPAINYLKTQPAKQATERKPALTQKQATQPELMDSSRHASIDPDLNRTLPSPVVSCPFELLNSAIFSAAPAGAGSPNPGPVPRIPLVVSRIHPMIKLNLNRTLSPFFNRIDLPTIGNPGEPLH
jgi:hypothetical protein